MAIQLFTTCVRIYKVIGKTYIVFHFDKHLSSIPRLLYVTFVCIGSFSVTGLNTIPVTNK